MAAGLSNAEVAEVYRVYGALVLRRCRLVLRDAALADDALQEVFVKVMRYGAELRTVDAPLRWLYRVADRCCFDLLAKAKRRRESELDVDLAGAHPEAGLVSRQVWRGLLAKLNDADRQLAVLAFVDELSQGEIADEIGCSRQTVNKRLGLIRERLQKLGGRDRV